MNDLTTALNITLVGMALVFATIILLWLVMLL
jgi:Na+-transporting methylmalonyl-CoA/oxaloacetate decarboxylase gamma subunit